jgi:hypothetical protein
LAPALRAQIFQGEEIFWKFRLILYMFGFSFHQELLYMVTGIHFIGKPSLNTEAAAPAGKVIFDNVLWQKCSRTKKLAS